jgi:DNA-binding response OmpR family regulator
MGKRILFASVDQPIVKAVNTMLEDMGHQVHMETSGAHALNTFTNNPGGFDLIITDLGMPDISGLRLAEMLLKVRANIPILLLTGLEGQAQSRARESGIHLFGIKPLSITELAETVKNALIETA